MAKNKLLSVFCFGKEVGRLGFDEDQNKTFFQYHPDFLKANKYPNLFPKTGIIKRVPQTQVFHQYNTATFRGLPPPIADSLPDMFGNIIFKTWLESRSGDFQEISVLEQLAYVANRGMGALEYRPSKPLDKHSTINLDEIVSVLQQVLQQKEQTQAKAFNQAALLNIFKIGTSAGGARPKILISEHKTTGTIKPGDLEYSGAYDHYLVKLALENNLGYHQERVEYSYYLLATQLGIRMMPSKLIDDKHFATLRFDRQAGKKQHILTATGMTGWDFQKSDNSSYENLFELALFLKLPHKEIEELFRRMVFNVVFCNMDDHLKNHSFIYDDQVDRWHLAPAYDLTYSLNPRLNFKRTSRALAINNKRVDITEQDLLKIADTYTIKQARKIIETMEAAIPTWVKLAKELDIPKSIIQAIKRRLEL